jgi:hypothetical protein
MDYRVTVTTEADQAETAAAVGRAMDIDVGGADSFIETDGKLQAQTWANRTFATMFQYLLANPAGLYQAVVADYEARWPDLAPPPVEAVEEFCQVTTLTVDPPL